jgi:hypothetical protein
MRHAIIHKAGDSVQSLKMKEEIESYIANAYLEQANEEMKDVYVTDHKPKQKRYSTNNLKEDEQFYRYKQALTDYNS